jgi:hypothetical protein
MQLLTYDVRKYVNERAVFKCCVRMGFKMLLTNEHNGMMLPKFVQIILFVITKDGHKTESIDTAPQKGLLYLSQYSLNHLD